MTPDQLRALADALDSTPASGMTRAADYLRRCADVQPVAWLYRDWANVFKVSRLDPHEDGAFAVFTAPQPQAEPKREPLSDEQIDKIGEPFGYFQYGDAQGDKRRAFARAVERAHRIGGSDAE